MKEQEKPLTPFERFLKKHPGIINGHMDGVLLGQNVKGVILTSG
jgi:hypothetical protein